MRGWNQETLADKSGVSIRTISYIETEEVSPTLKTLQALADALEVSVGVLAEKVA